MDKVEKPIVDRVEEIFKRRSHLSECAWNEEDSCSCGTWNCYITDILKDDIKKIIQAYRIEKSKVKTWQSKWMRLHNEKENK